MACLIWEFGGSIQQIQKLKSPENKFKFATLPIHKPFFLKDLLYECVAYQLDDLIPTIFCGSVVTLSN